MAAVTEHRAQIDGREVAWRAAAGPAGQAPVLYVHGVPSASHEWTGFLGQSGGIAPDLPGFGGSAPLPEATMEGFARFLEAFLDHLGIATVRLMVHDWGGVGLLWAMRAPERVERLVVSNSVTFTPGYRWHRIARAWRTPRVGEALMAGLNGPALWFISLESNATPGGMPKAWRRETLAGIGPDTKRAILQLYRSSPESKLEAAGADLGRIDCPTQIVWGLRDPYIAPRFPADLARAIGPNAELVAIEDAGHWPWVDRPDLVGRITGFLTAP